MNRLLVFALVASIGNVSVAFAGETILTSGTRHVQQLASTETVAPSTPALPAAKTTVGRKAEAAAFQEQGGTLSRHGMSKGKKALIYIGLAAVFVASVYVIDQNVLDVTPSSLGTRQD